MALVISYLLIFGLISCIRGKQADDSQNGIGIVDLFAGLAHQNGNFGIKFSHQDNPKGQHKGKTRMTSHAENVQKNDRHDNDDYKAAASLLQSIYNIQTMQKGALSNINLLVPVRTKLRDCASSARCKDTKHLLKRNRVEAHINNVLDFLSELDKNFGKDDPITGVQNADRNSNNHQNHQKQRMPKIIQLSENADAVMLDTDTFERLVSNLNFNKKKEKRGKVLDNVEVGRLHKGNNNNKNYNSDSIVYVEQAKDGNALVKKLQKLL
ncbi:unnamed protein product [Spodoptera littoralis]|uniref:Uncharacterized protein n=1 Tax=Spodoptera littoralis TaxID=7109 RepID=A0A9P0I6V9_SPOLI|nr:unnamed protein product [Spodoptera littoralis]CAH1640853.1 unnamed protein product [Spodoptera littoralis]